jgi:hypothetical protein
MSNREWFFRTLLFNLILMVHVSIGIEVLALLFEDGAEKLDEDLFSSPIAVTIDSSDKAGEC